MSYNVAAIRQSIKAAVNGRHADPDEFKPDKAKDSTTALKYRFFILPPLMAGDVLKSGEVKKSMDQFFITNGQHWVNDRPHACPRVYDGSKCAICDFGFKLLAEHKENKGSDEAKRAIIKQWMPTTYYMVNIFFSNSKMNPEELRGKARFYNAPKTCLDKWYATLMREDKGDDEDPDAFGVFFDENAAFMFELNVLKDGKSNGYKTSAFVKNNGVPTPMVKNADGTPNASAIATLLKMRINLWDKIPEPNSEAVDRLATTMISGSDDDSSTSSFDGDETIAEAVAPPLAKAVARTTQPAAKTASKAAPAASSKAATAKPAAKAEPAKKPAPAASDTLDDDVVSLLDDESPIEDTVAPPADDDEVATPDSDSDLTGDDIDSLMSQLEE